jgi:hypothetical protein
MELTRKQGEMGRQGSVIVLTFDYWCGLQTATFLFWKVISTE